MVLWSNLVKQALVTQAVMMMDLVEAYSKKDAGVMNVRNLQRAVDAASHSSPFGGPSPFPEGFGGPTSGLS